MPPLILCAKKTNMSAPRSQRTFSSVAWSASCQWRTLPTRLFRQNTPPSALKTELALLLAALRQETCRLDDMAVTDMPTVGSVPSSTSCGLAADVLGCAGHSS